MATYYWVGGSGNWNATSTTNWATSSGGAGSAGVPTSADNVIFDANSNVGTGAFTVTVTGTSAAPATCADFSTGGAGGALDGAMTLTMGATAVLSCYGSMTFPATNFSVSGTVGAAINFLATTTGKTLTTNGVSFGAVNLVFGGIGGGWTLGSALTSTQAIFPNAGTFDTGNYNLTVNSIQRTASVNTTTFNLGSSTVTCSGSGPISFTSPSGLTFNAGTSQITCSNASPTFTGGGQTFYNVTFSSTALSGATITGSNTFNNFTVAARAAAGIGLLSLQSTTTNTINGTLTLGSGTTGVARLIVFGSTLGSPATLSVATLAAITDIDFRDITVSGASSPWSGTRIGDCGGNTNITGASPRTVYWNSAASANWNGAVWSTSSGNTGGTTTAFPLAQDTVIIDNAGLTTGNTITLNASYQLPNIDFSSRSNAATFATGTISANIYGNYILSSAITVSGTGTLIFAKQNSVATITSAGVSFTQAITINAPLGTVRINGNLTLGSTLTTTLTAGTLDLTNNGAGNYTLSTGLFSSSNSNTRAITFDTGSINVTASATTVWTTAIATNFSYTGTPTVNLTYSGSTGTRSIAGNLTGVTESNVLNFNITAGTDTVSLAGTASGYNNLNFTGFVGTAICTNSIQCFGNLIVSSGMTFTPRTTSISFNSATKTQQITTNDVTLDFPIFVGAGTSNNTLQLQDNLTLGSTRAFTLTSGTLDLTKGGTANLTLSTGIFISSNSNTRSIAFGVGNITLTGNAATIWSNGTITNFSYTGTPIINCTYNGSVGVRNIIAGLGEATALSFNISAGSDTVTFAATSAIKNLDFTGFTGTLSNNTRTYYGNVTFSSGMTLTSGVSINSFSATSGTQQITTNGKTLDFPLTFNGLGGTFAFQDALTMGGTRTLTLNAGSLLFKSGTTNTVGTAVLSGNNSSNTRLGATEQQFAAFLQKVIGGTITASNITIENSTVTPVNTWYGDLTTVDGGNNTNWTFAQTDVRGHDAFLPQEIRHFKDLDKKTRAAEAARIRAAKLVAYHRKRRFKELLAPELINPQEESFYEQLREEQYPEEVAKEKAEKAKAEHKAKVEAKKRELKKELKRLEKEEKEAEQKVLALKREKELLIEAVMQRQKMMEIQAQLAIIEKLRQEEMDDEAALLLLI